MDTDMETDYTSEDADEQIEIPKNKPYKCLINGCSSSYSKKFKLEIHNRKHSGERPFVCKVSGCNKSYTNIAHLKRHNSVHFQTATLEVMCTAEGCGLVLSNKYALKKHQTTAHSESSYTFQCTDCSQKFKKKWQLTEHRFVHTGELPYKCDTCPDICNSRFETLSSYNKHKRNHKTYTCDCGEQFLRWSLFCAHRRNVCTIRKIEHKCTICQKIFTTKTNLTQHSLKVHVEESQKEINRCPYVDCKRSYLYKKNLSFHISTFHLKQRTTEPCSCTKPGCDQVLKSKKNLKQHLHTIHREVPKEPTIRKPRKDKGKGRTDMAVVLSGINCLKDKGCFIGSDDSETCTAQTQPQPEVDKIAIESHDATLVLPQNVIDKTTEELEINMAEPRPQKEFKITTVENKTIPHSPSQRMNITEATFLENNVNEKQIDELLDSDCSDKMLLKTCDELLSKIYDLMPNRQSRS